MQPAVLLSLLVVSVSAIPSPEKGESKTLHTRNIRITSNLHLKRGAIADDSFEQIVNAQENSAEAVGGAVEAVAGATEAAAGALQAGGGMVQAAGGALQAVGGAANAEAEVVNAIANLLHGIGGGLRSTTM